MASTATSPYRPGFDADRRNTLDRRRTAGADAARAKPVSLTALDNVATVLLYGSLAVIFLWIGAMKFTAYEAKGIAVFTTNSPLTGWLYGLFSERGASNVFGIYEIATGVLLASRIVSPTLSAAGAALAVLTFIVTLSFMFTTPGVGAAQAGGFPALSAEVGQFLAKDTVLLAASVYALAESLRQRARQRGDRERTAQA